MDLVAVLTQVITKNEIDDNIDFAYRFSDPDGIRTGKSGYSFGRCQFDLLNNPVAVTCLFECGFTKEEIQRLKAQDGPIADLDAKLKAHAAIVDRYDHAQIAGIVSWVKQISAQNGVSYANDEAFIHACDYHNQFHMNANGKAMAFFVNLHRPVTAKDVLTYKLGTIWGRKRPDDVRRRYDNIAKIMRG